MRHGAYSPEYINFFEALLDAPPGRMAATAQALLDSRVALHPLFVEIAEMFVRVEIDICEESRWRRLQGE
jgi:hypothetical protein